MPIGHIQSNARPDVEALIQRLTQEWQRPDPTVEEPILIEQQNPHRENSVYVYVVWQAWRPLSQRERSEIIMDAYAATHSKEEIMDVTATIGLTALEAADRKIYYTTENAA
jgi:hypothetical protein